MAIVILLGGALVAYSRQAAPSNDTPPTINDHWHVSYGFYVCDQQVADLKGTAEEPVNPLYVKYGIHSHDDGVIHWHPQALATGRRAKIGLFLDTYGVKVDADGITFPSDQMDGKSYKVGEHKCKDKSGKEVDGQVQVVVWDAYDDPNSQKKYITDFDNIRVDRDQMAIMFAFAPAGADIPMPISAANLPELGDVDGGDEPTTTVAGGSTTTVAGGSTTTVAGGSTTTVASTTTGG